MEKMLLSRKRAAEMLSISKDTLDRLCARNEVHPLRIGSRVYFVSDDLQKFIDRLVRKGFICTW